jgi:hypothetical protein
VTQVTLVGVARFLDNFGNLYGNKLGAGMQKQHESTLVAVLQAFSLQWLPTSVSPETCNALARVGASALPLMHNFVGDEASQSARALFLDAWFRAHSCLTRSTETRSFRHIYSVFLFQMITTPSEARTLLKDGERPEDLFEKGVRELQQLQKLVHKYCNQLSVNSMYRMLLETAVSIFQWHGYVRDTVNALLDGTPCVCPDILHRTGMSDFFPVGTFIFSSSCVQLRT